MSVNAYWRVRVDSVTLFPERSDKVFISVNDAERGPRTLTLDAQTEITIDNLGRADAATLSRWLTFATNDRRPLMVYLTIRDPNSAAFKVVAATFNRADR